MIEFKIIAVDFDGTLCENKWPEIGEINSHLFQLLTYEKSRGNKIILWTCRSGDRLTEAVNWCKEHGLEFDAVNENLPEAIEEFGLDTRKIFAHVYIDDRNMPMSVAELLGEQIVCESHKSIDPNYKMNYMYKN